MCVSTAFWSSSLDSGENASAKVLIQRPDCFFLTLTLRDIFPRAPSNMFSLVACDFTQGAVLSLCLKALVLRNMLSMSVTRDTSHLEMSINQSINQSMVHYNVNQSINDI